MKDGYLDIMATGDRHWAGTVAAMGNPAWAQDPIFDVPSWERVAYADAIDDLMQPWLDTHTKEEAFAILQAERVPAGPVYNANDLIDHPHLKAKGFFPQMDHPVMGPVRVPGKPYDLSRTPWSLRRPAPTLGQHNQLILGGRLGFSDTDLTDLRRTGTI